MNSIRIQTILSKLKPLVTLIYLIALSFFLLTIALFFIAFYEIFKILAAARNRHLNFFTSDSFHFYQWTQLLFMLILICFLIIGITVTYIQFFTNIRGGALMDVFVYSVTGIAGLLLGVFAYISPKSLGQEPDFNKLLNHVATTKTNNKPLVRNNMKLINSNYCAS